MTKIRKKMKNKMLNRQSIKKHFNGDAKQLNILTLDSVSSTNDIAKEELIQHPHQISLVATNKQTAGRGRQGKSFYSSLAHGLYFSLAFQPNEEDLKSIPLYTIMAAATLVEVLEKVVDKPVSIKWVNDIFYEGRKISGILSELTLLNTEKNQLGVVVGIGINFAGSFQTADENTQNVAGTLFGEKLPREFDQNTFLGDFLNTFNHYHGDFQNKSFMSTYEEHLLGKGKKVFYTVKDKKHQGIIQGIDRNGHLLVLKPDQTIETLYGQEIHFNSSQFVDVNPTT